MGTEAITEAARSGKVAAEAATEAVGAEGTEVVRAAEGIFAATVGTAAITEVGKDVGAAAGSEAITEMRTRARTVAGTAAIAEVGIERQKEQQLLE